MNRKHFCLLPPFIRKFGMIPESYKIAMTYEEQLLFLCKYVEDLGLEIENIKTALLNIQTAIEELDSTVSQIRNNVDVLTEMLNGAYLITLTKETDKIDTFILTYPTGYYYTGMNVLTTTDGSITIPRHSLFFYDNSADCFKIYEGTASSVFRFIFFDEDTQSWIDTQYMIADFVNQYSTHYQIPTAKAVYDAIQEGGGGTTDYDDLNNKPSINGVTLEGDLTTSDLNIDAIPTLDEDFNVWELEQGLYKFPEGVKLNYGNDNLSYWEAKNEYAYLIVGRNSTDDITNYTVFDKSSAGDLSSAIFCGYSRITEIEPNLTVIGIIVEEISTYVNYETISNKIVTSSLSASSTYAQYPSAKTVYDFVMQEVGNITLILQNINTGSGV